MSYFLRAPEDSNSNDITSLILIWVGFLGVGFEVKLSTSPYFETCLGYARNVKFITYTLTQI